MYSRLFPRLLQGKLLTATKAVIVFLALLYLDLGIERHSVILVSQSTCTRFVFCIGH